MTPDLTDVFELFPAMCRSRGVAGRRFAGEFSCFGVRRAQFTRGTRHRRRPLNNKYKDSFYLLLGGAAVGRPQRQSRIPDGAETA